MTHLQFIFILFLISGCSGTNNVLAKPIAKNNESKPKIEENKQTNTLKADSILQKTTSIKNEANIITKDTIFKSFDHSIWNNLLNKYVSINGNVNYRGFKENQSDLKKYIVSLNENMPTESWSKEEKLAYWINAYNAMTIDLILRYYPINSIKDIKNPWDKRLWKLGKKWYNLNEIEHDILRKMNEPRIHFAIVCASYSCPKLLNKAFKASNLDNQLTEATKSFLGDKTRNRISDTKIELSKIFKWFAKDFNQDGSLIDFLNKYTSIEILKEAKIIYIDYNWDLNE